MSQVRVRSTFAGPTEMFVSFNCLCMIISSFFFCVNCLILLHARKNYLGIYIFFLTITITFLGNEHYCKLTTLKPLITAKKEKKCRN